MRRNLIQQRRQIGFGAAFGDLRPRSLGKVGGSAGIPDPLCAGGLIGGAPTVAGGLIRLGRVYPRPLFGDGVIANPTRCLRTPFSGPFLDRR